MTQNTISSFRMQRKYLPIVWQFDKNISQIEYWIMDLQISKHYIRYIAVLLEYKLFLQISFINDRFRNQLLGLLVPVGTISYLNYTIFIESVFPIDSPSGYLRNYSSLFINEIDSDGQKNQNSNNHFRVYLCVVLGIFCLRDNSWMPSMPLVPTLDIMPD